MTTEPRPSENTDWGESSSNVTEPSASKKSNGWSFEDILPSDNLNWIQRAIGRWISYLDSKLTGDYGSLESTSDSTSKFDLSVEAGLSANADEKRILAGNTPVGIATVSSGGVINESVGIESVTNSSTGTYEVTVDDPVPSGYINVLIAKTSQFGAQAVGGRSTGRTANVSTRDDTDTASNESFRVMAFYLPS